MMPLTCFFRRSMVKRYYYEIWAQKMGSCLLKMYLMRQDLQRTRFLRLLPGSGITITTDCQTYFVQDITSRSRQPGMLPRQHLEQKVRGQERCSFTGTMETARLKTFQKSLDSNRSYLQWVQTLATSTMTVIRICISEQVIRFINRFCQTKCF